MSLRRSTLRRALRARAMAAAVGTSPSRACSTAGARPGCDPAPVTPTPSRLTRPLQAHHGGDADHSVVGGLVGALEVAPGARAEAGHAHLHQQLVRRQGGAEEAGEELRHGHRAPPLGPWSISASRASTVAG